MRFLNTTKFSLSSELSSDWNEFEQARHAVLGLTAELNTARTIRRIQFLGLIIWWLRAALAVGLAASRVCDGTDALPDVYPRAMNSREATPLARGADGGRGGHGPFEMMDLRV
jgi:hypothetical protein